MRQRQYLSLLSSSLLVLSVTLAACGDDGGGTAIDARAADAVVRDTASIDTPDVDATSIDATEVDATEIDATDVDAGPTVDAAATIDAIDVDGGTTIDATPTTDAALPIDGPLPIDGGVTLAGETCQTAEVITAPAVPGTVTVTATTAGYTSNYNPACGMSNQAGPDRVHVITIPGNTRLTATVDPTTATFDPGIHLIATPAANCDAAAITCLTANDNGGDGANDTITFDNTSASPRDVLIVIDTFRATGDAYSLIAAFSAIPAALPGDTCQTAETITVPGGLGTLTVTSTTLGYTSNYNPACAMVNSGGPDRIHVVSVPANRILTVTVDPTSATYDPGIYLIAGPAATCDAVPLVCLASNDDGGDGANDLVTFSNTTAAARDVQILVDGFRPAGDAYSLIVTLAAP